jgi:ABC-type dipeptide/oligopeptide/nickel transport system permease component
MGQAAVVSLRARPDAWDTPQLGAHHRSFAHHFTPVGYGAGKFAVTAVLTKTPSEEIRKQYVLTARTKALSEDRVLYKHVSQRVDPSSPDSLPPLCVFLQARCY